MSTPAQRRARRRRVLPGFPKNEAFTSIVDVRAYLCGSRIVCLLCGRSLRRLAVHLPSIHEMTEDDYRAKYAIPWGYGLGSEDYRGLVSESVRHRIDDGRGSPTLGKGVEHFPDRRPTPHKAEIARMNLGDKLGSVAHQTDGHKTKRAAALRTAMGSDSHREKLRLAFTPERRQALSVSARARFIGVPKSPEQRARMSRAAIAAAKKLKQP